jgi:hypothetical protein
MLNRNIDAINQGAPVRRSWWAVALIVVALLAAAVVVLRQTRPTGDRPTVRLSSGGR